MNTNTSMSLLLCAVAAACILWWLDVRRVRRAAQKIDARFKSLDSPPTFSPLHESDDIPASAIAKLDAFDDALATGMGFTVLGRLREFSVQGALLGVRTVLVNADRTITATFAMSHTNAAISFRSFCAELQPCIVCSSDARSVSPPSPNLVKLHHGKADESIALLQALQEKLNALDGHRLPFDSLDAYTQMQVRMWHFSREARLKNANVIDLDTLRRLAPAGFSERRLRRVHDEIVRLNRG